MRATQRIRSGKLFVDCRMRNFAQAASAFAILGSGLALAQDPRGMDETAGPALTPVQALQRLAQPVTYVVPLDPDISTLYADGSQIPITQEQRWTFMCGTIPAARNLQALQLVADETNVLWDGGAPSVIIDAPIARGGAINFVFNVDASVPAAAVTALVETEAYLESLFGDPITITINLSYANMGSGVIGATGSQYVTGVSYANSRSGLVGGMDSNDTIHNFLPAGTTMPVRFDGASATITNEGAINWTRANYRATVGTVAGSAASMTLNTDFTFDYNPDNGITGESFIDIMCHETGHAMGFVSAVDTGSTSDTDALDIFRFARTDAGMDYNPDTTAEFQTAPRLNDFNAPDDDHQFDIISVEYRLSDGNPWQASHFREQGISIGLMDPAYGGGTNNPNFFRVSDLNVFDAIGYDYPPCAQPAITQQPIVSQTLCAEATANFSVATDAVGPTYQWRKGPTNLTNGGRISGATSATLTITGLLSTDAATDYNCVITANSCSAISDESELIINNIATFTAQPSSGPIDAGSDLFIGCSVSNPNDYSYRWYRNGVAMNDDGRIFGSTSPTLQISPVVPNDAADYFCRVTAEIGGCPNDSNTATITVDCAAGGITTQPQASQTICLGSNASFTVAGNAITPTYQWRKGVTNLVNGGSISGATTATLLISNAQASDAAANYNCVITDTTTTCVYPSNNATLNVDQSQASITDQPDAASVNEGDTINLAVVVTNPGNYTYQWRKGGLNVTNGGRVSGATAAALQITAAIESDEASYDVIVTPIGGVCGPTTSSAAFVTVNAAPPGCVEDLSGNGTIDLTDLSILLSNFGLSGGVTPAQGDLDDDDDVDLSDLSRLLARFGSPC
ncbi:MAG: NF038122 family metalloprotease [Phycisphaerae bacterium]